MYILPLQRGPAISLSCFALISLVRYFGLGPKKLVVHYFGPIISLVCYFEKLFKELFDFQVKEPAFNVTIVMSLHCTAVAFTFHHTGLFKVNQEMAFSRF